MEVTADRKLLDEDSGRLISPGSFDPGNHFYARVLNAHIHPMVAYFFRLTTEKIVKRYCHLNPRVDPSELEGILKTRNRYLRWSGTDLFCTTTSTGNRRLVVLETNSCPSGNKSMPILSEENELGGYRTVIEHAFADSLKRQSRVSGDLAVVYDKNFIEASAYAAAIADVASEAVHLVPFLHDTATAPARFDDGLLEVKSAAGRWRPIRAAFRYVTQRPWSRFPIRTRTRVLNPIIACLAGGRNKLVASKAYELYNAQLVGTGLRVRAPTTVPDVSIEEIPLAVARFGGQAVIKDPYSNAGQGVFPILSETDLQAFLDLRHNYDRFIVQSLIGNYAWSSTQESGRYYHVGTMPDRHGDIYAADLRMMICSGPDGFRPVAIYARRAAAPLAETLSDGMDSWSMLGTNLSLKMPDGTWAAETNRLLLMDRRDFNRVGIGGDDLIEAFVQSVLATRAIDNMASALLTKKRSLRMRLFSSLNSDATLLNEIRSCTGGVRDPIGAVR